MRALHHSIFAICVCAALAGPESAAAQDRPASLWDLNGSVLGLYADGAERVFRYEEPRAAVQQEGVRPGTVVFKGTLAGKEYLGTAFVFHRHCDPYPFQVQGTVVGDERRITLNGPQPTAFDQDCDPVDFEDVEFDITFLRSIMSPPLVYSSIDRAPAAVKEVEEQEEHHVATHGRRAQSFAQVLPSSAIFRPVTDREAQSFDLAQLLVRDSEGNRL